MVDDGEDDDVDDDRHVGDDDEGETTKAVAYDDPETKSRTEEAALWNFILICIIFIRVLLVDVSGMGAGR